VLKFAPFVKRFPQARNDFVPGLINLKDFQYATVLIVPQLVALDAMK
jgi:hypothetical protein